MLRPVLLLTALALTCFAPPAQAQSRVEGPWCAYMQMGGGFIQRNCGMMNYDQCRNYIFATPGTWCTENPWYVPPQQKQRRKAKKRS